VGFGFAVNQETSTPQKLVIEMKPERLWQFLPTTWNNEDWCNLLVVGSLPPPHDPRNITFRCVCTVLINPGAVAVL